VAGAVQPERWNAKRGSVVESHLGTMTTVAVALFASHLYLFPVQANENELRISNYTNFVKQIRVSNGHIAWSDLELGRNRLLVEKSLGKPLQLQKQLDSNYSQSKITYRQTDVTLIFASGNPSAKLIAVSVGFDGRMIPESDVKDLESRLVRQLPGIKRYIPPGYSSSSAWQLPGHNQITIVIKQDGLSVGFDFTYD
jgi:hypothetical protein